MVASRKIFWQRISTVSVVFGASVAIIYLAITGRFHPMKANPHFLFPSAEEFLGYYNVPDDATDNTPVLRSAARVPDWSFDEMSAVCKETEQWFSQNLAASENTGRFDPVREALSVRGGTDDRTLLVDIPDVRLLNEGLLHRLQMELLRKHSFWRIALVAEDAKTSVMVYPEVIRVGNRPATTNIDQALYEMDLEVRKLKQVRLDPKRRETEYLRRKIPEAIRQIGDKPFQVVGIIDEYHGDRSRGTIYLLLNGTDYNAISVEGPEGPDHIWKGSAYGLSATGEIISESRIPETAAFCVVPWLPPSDYRGPVTLIEHAMGVQYVLEIKSESIESVGDL